MIDVLKQQLLNNMPDEEKLNRAREFLQIICLKIMYDKDILNSLSFVGGTALRFIFDLKRFSEDLDFSLIHKKSYNFTEINTELIRGLKLFGFTAETKPKEENTVHSTMLKFSGLLKEIGLSPLKDQKLSIKFEVDTNPPKGAVLTNSYVNKLYQINIPHFDLSSMLATKLHACFYRKYTKGRDFYDFIWYLGKKVKPNYLLLNNAIKQTQGENPKIDADNFKKFLLERLEKIDYEAAKKDVERFLEDKNELKLFKLEAIKGAVASIY